MNELAAAFAFLETGRRLVPIGGVTFQDARSDQLELTFNSMAR